MANATNLERLAFLRRRLEGQIETAQEQLAKFQAKLSEDPVYALEWAGSACHAAAELKLAQDILHWMGDPSGDVTEEDAGTFLEHLIKQLTEDCLRAARHPERSTSPWSNEMARELASAKGRLLERLGGWW